MIAAPLSRHAQMVIDAPNAGKRVSVKKTMYFKKKKRATKSERLPKQFPSLLSSSACNRGRACFTTWPCR